MKSQKSKSCKCECHKEGFNECDQCNCKSKSSRSVHSGDTGNSETKRLENGLYPKAKQDQWTLNRVKSDKTENPDIIDEFCQYHDVNHYQVVDGIELYDFLKRFGKLKEEQIAEEIKNWVEEHEFTHHQGGFLVYADDLEAFIDKKYLGGLK